MELYSSTNQTISLSTSPALTMRVAGNETIFPIRNAMDVTIVWLVSALVDNWLLEAGFLCLL
jgi:hypothetical protein